MPTPDTVYDDEPTPEYAPFDPRLPVATHPWHCTVCGADLPADLDHRPACCPLCGRDELQLRPRAA